MLPSSSASAILAGKRGFQGIKTQPTMKPSSSWSVGADMETSAMSPVIAAAQAVPILLICGHV
jgi:hypothetical protein